MRRAVLGLFVSLVALQAWPAIDWNSGVSYWYDGSGNLRQIGTDSFVYDAAGRLVQGDTNGVRRNYAYDAFGNRQTCLQPGTDCQWAYRISAVNNRIEGVGYSQAGNLTRLEGHTYSYDALNMLTRDVSADGIREYVYTADDERIAVYTVNTGSWRWTLRDTSGKVLRELTSQNPASGPPGSASWKWIRDYVWRDNLLLATRQMEPGSITPTTYHYHLDHLGTPRRVTDDANRIVGVHNYHPFGPELTQDQRNEPSLTLLKYTAHERDLVGPIEEVTTLDYMHARYYSPAMGRFSSVDPALDLEKIVHEPQLWNRYAYVGNNPIRYTDPDGRERLSCAGFAQTGRCAAVPWRGAATEISEQFTIASMLGMPMPGEGLLGRLFGAVGRVLGAASEEVALSRGIMTALGSAEAATRLEGEAAVALGETVTGFQKVVTQGGKVVGEIDVETTKAIVESKWSCTRRTSDGRPRRYSRKRVQRL